MVQALPSGKIHFVLFISIVPKTVENFFTLCTGKKGNGETTGKPFHYKNSTFHRVIPNFVLQGGDFTLGNERDRELIYGGKFPDKFENGIMEHSVPGLLSMANSGRNTNRSQFCVTCAKAKYLDGKHVVFGRVVGEGGMDVVRAIEGVGCRSGDTDSPVRITACGEGEGTVVGGWTRRRKN